MKIDEMFLKFTKNQLKQIDSSDICGIFQA